MSRQRFIGAQTITLLLLLVIALPDARGFGQSKDPAPSQPQTQAPTQSPQDVEGPKRPNKVGKELVLNMLDDQKAIWTSPARLHFRDLKWIVPLGGLTAGLIAYDSDISRNVAAHPNLISPLKTFSDLGLYSAIAGSGALYLAGKWHGNDHMRETGLLAGEAFLDSYAVTEVFKVGFRRPRPLDSDGNGRFFHGGVSFPSEHATATFSIASVIAHEYPGPLTKVGVYSAATAISVARVMGRQHFPSDILIGAGIGWLTGRQVYRAHHDPELP